MRQDQILTHLNNLKNTRGQLRRFCLAYNLPYTRVWKFVSGETKSVSLEFGDELEAAITNFITKNQ